MAGSYLLDTNIVIYYFGEDADIVARLDALEKVFFPLFVLGELYYGVFNSDRKTANLAKLAQFIGKFDILLSRRGNESRIWPNQSGITAKRTASSG